MRGHFGILCGYRCIAQSVNWIGMKKVITDFVARCSFSNRIKLSVITTRPSSTFTHSDGNMGRYKHGFTISVAKSYNYDIILVVVDRFSKYAHFISIKQPSSATITKNKFKEMVKLHGIPSSIVRNQDPAFLSLF